MKEYIKRMIKVAFGRDYMFLSLMSSIVISGPILTAQISAWWLLSPFLIFGIITSTTYNVLYFFTYKRNQMLIERLTNLRDL